MDKPMDYTENLQNVAKLSFEAAQIHCAECRDYHATWTYRRMIGAVGGIEADRPQLMPLLRELSSEPSIRRWLIPGSADSGILAIIAASITAPRDAKFIVVDRCATPLEVCRDYATSCGLDLETHTIELAKLTLDRPADAIVAHSVTNFIPTPDRQEILARLKDNLRSKGHFILCTKYRSGSANENLANREERILAALRAALAAGTIDLPEPQSDFEKRLRHDARSISSRDNLPETPESAADALSTAGFTIDRIIRAEIGEYDARQTSRQSRFRSIIYARS